MARVEVKRVRVVDRTRAVRLAVAEVADTPVTRMVGLLGRRSLATGHGMVLEPCAMVHTCFMRFSIDVLFLDTGGRVVRAVRDLKPFRLAWGFGARMTVELPAGTLREAGVIAGDEMGIEPV